MPRSALSESDGDGRGEVELAKKKYRIKRGKRQRDMRVCPRWMRPPRVSISEINRGCRRFVRGDARERRGKQERWYRWGQTGRRREGMIDRGSWKLRFGFSILVLGKLIAFGSTGHRRLTGISKGTPLASSFLSLVPRSLLALKFADAFHSGTIRFKSSEDTFARSSKVVFHSNEKCAYSLETGKKHRYGCIVRI